MASSTLNAVSLRLQAGGPQTALQLAATLKVDRSVVSRAISGAGDAIQQIGAARRTRYAMRRKVRANGNRWPIYRIDQAGRPSEICEFEAFSGGWRVSWKNAPDWDWLVTDQDNWAEGFPFFFEDLRPQGFIGRLLARQHSQPLALPIDPTSWSDDDTLHFLLAEGHDVPSNFVMGDAALRRALPLEIFPAVANRAEQYPQLAAQALQGVVPGSSAAGEQQKFATRIQDGADTRSVLVKFSPPVDTPVGRRWADLLVAEEIASHILSASESGAATAGCFDAGERRFLEITRFDRQGAQGRRGVVSLSALQGSHAGAEAINWIQASEHLQEKGVLSEHTVTAVRQRSAFGELIGNTDMHLGNLSLFLDDKLPLTLTPSYDMLPMLWAPVGSEILGRSLKLLPPTPRQAEDWSIAAGWAEAFWGCLASDQRISPQFREIATRSGESVSLLRKRYGHYGGGQAVRLPNEDAVASIDFPLPVTDSSPRAQPPPNMQGKDPPG